MRPSGKLEWGVIFASFIMGALLMTALALWLLAGLYFLGLFVTGLVCGIIWPRGVLFITLGIILGQAVAAGVTAGLMGLGLAFTYYIIFSLIGTAGALTGAGIRWMVTTIKRAGS
jgi:hypothetical protein